MGVADLLETAADLAATDPTMTVTKAVVMSADSPREASAALKFLIDVGAALAIANFGRSVGLREAAKKARGQ